MTSGGGGALPAETCLSALVPAVAAGSTTGPALHPQLPGLTRDPRAGASLFLSRDLVPRLIGLDAELFSREVALLGTMSVF